ncbi:unnamed protein product [Spirodela intermedia]|uniref:Uncharacterized protein n=2 Tax=Spirodela intermedia TaxID=51605 RepID=A0A7I8JQG4_SPIIN|nr:unnamed protein product [Spirodela intermedia]CAA6672417.1 unnamed protein product [Spirodela intermedia]CAA7409609.1 unnamed protein product [Spirodela intermedia]
MNCRSIVLAPTVRIHGATFSTVSQLGPELPPEHTTVIPFFTAWNDPMASPSLILVKGGQDVGTEAVSTLCGAPAHLVGRHPGAGRPTLGRTVPEAEETGVRHEPASGGGKGVGAVAGRVAGGDLAGS